MEHKLNIVVFGAGMVVHEHLSNYRSSPQTEVVCIVDTNEILAKETAEEYSIPNIETDYIVALKKYQPDLVLVATPHFLHQRMVIDSLEHGCHVICEKPFGMTAAECDEMIAVAKKHDRRLFVSHNMRKELSFQKIKQTIVSGRIGRVFLAELKYLGYEVERLSDPNSWKGTKEYAGGGVLIDAGCHMVDLTNFFFGLPISVEAMMQRSVIAAENKGEDNALLHFEYRDNLMVDLLVSFVAKTEGSNKGPSLMLGVAVYGTEGSIYGGYRPARGWDLAIVENDQEQNLSLPEQEQLNLDHHFIDCILNNAEPIITMQQARDNIAIIEAAYRANREKRRIEL